MSPKSASLAKKWGFKSLKVYVKGLPVWKKKNKATTTVKYVKSGNIVLVDLREPNKAGKGHIPRAYSVPLKQLSASKALFPKSKGTPFVIYSDSDKDILSAKKIFKKFKYKTVIGFYNGLALWEKAGHKLNKGPALMASAKKPIAYSKKLNAGEIGITDFEKSLKSDLIFVVDARTPEEYIAGNFPGSVNIPLEQMQKRMNEIPKDKFVVVHCKTGGRGAIGYRLLKEAGFSVKFLNAECACKPSGEYEIW